MATKTIKISEENYRQLTSIAGELQQAEGRSVSMDDALRKVLARPKPRKTMADLANMKNAKEFADVLEAVYKETRKYKGRDIPSW